MACRIYPADANPLGSMDPALRRCPEAAWLPSGPPLLQGIRCVDASTHSAIAQRQQAAVADAFLHAALCASLGLRTAALANEGYAVHTPARPLMLEVLRELAHTPVAAPIDAATGRPDAIAQNWLCLSQRDHSLALLRSADAHCAAPPQTPSNTVQGDVQYLSWFAS